MMRSDREDRLGVNPVPMPEEAPAAWTVRRAEELIGSLSGVLSARIVAGRGGEIPYGAIAHMQRVGIAVERMRRRACAAAKR